MDLTSRNRFSRRLDVLRNALSEGKGLSQLKSSQETENDQQHRIEEETYPSGRTAVLSSDETYASRQKPGEEAEESMDQHDSHSNPLPSTNVLLEPDSARQGAQPYLITDVAHDEKDRTEPQTGSKGNPQEAGTRDDIFSVSAESKESLGPAQPSAAETAIRKAEDSVVDHGDFIDYEDIEELEEGTSSASSTLQGDAFDVNAVQDHAVSDQSIVAENQELQSPNDDQENAVADEEILHEFKDEKDISSIGVAVQKEQPNLEEVLSQDSDDKGQSLPQHSNEEWEAPENDQDASISQETESRPKVNADDDQYEASAPYEDDAGSYQHDTLPEHPDQKEDDAYPLAESSSIGEIEDHSSTHPFQSESSGSGRNFRDDDLGRVDDLDAENELDESDRLSANDENNHIPHPPEGVDIQTSLAFDESAPTQEDDDEITYEDEEYDTDFPHESAKAEHNVSTSPGFHKRARSFHEDSDDALGEDLQGRDPSFGLYYPKLH